MKAVVCHRYGSPEVLKLEQIRKPVVSDDGVLVRVHASSVNPVDLYFLTVPAYTTRMLTGLLKPRGEVPGTDFAGTVESVGRSVRRFQPGDEVFGGGSGAFAEYVCVPEQAAVARKPVNVTFEQAAAVPLAAITALQAVRDHGQIRPGQKVLINGASGGVGTFAVQIAKSFGAEVTGVCSSRNVDIVRSIGADRVIDYTQEDFIQGGQRYDLMLDIAGNRSWSECTRVLEPKATLVAVGVASVQYNSAWRALSHFVNVRLAAVGGSRKLVLFLAKLNQKDLVMLQELLEAGRVTPVIDRRYDLSEVSASLRYLARRTRERKDCDQRMRGGLPLRSRQPAHPSQLVHDVDVQIRIDANDLPAGSCGPSPNFAGGCHNIHVGVQHRNRRDRIPVNQSQCSRRVCGALYAA